MPTVKQKKTLADLQASDRHALIGKIKIRAKEAYLDSGTPEYRVWLAKYAMGKTSCGQMDHAELSAALDRMDGKTPMVDTYPEPSAKLKGAAIPTARQWGMLAGLSRDMGWDGLADSRLIQHCQHTAKVDALGDLTRRHVSDCIAGLERRKNQLEGKVTAAVFRAKLAMRKANA